MIARLHNVAGPRGHFERLCPWPDLDHAEARCKSLQRMRSASSVLPVSCRKVRLDGPRERGEIPGEPLQELRIELSPASGVMQTRTNIEAHDFGQPGGALHCRCDRTLRR